jgi:phenylpropionate dioxygenase-like ring-hydroxylating dioxygenase large terminal subunit
MKTFTDSHKWSETYAKLGTNPIPVGPNTSPEYFNQEREKIFRRSWLYLAREDQLKQRGDYLTKRIPILGASVLVVRDKDDQIRAFHNVCKHRANTLARAAKGHAKQFTCDFHGWTYDLQGQLKFVPDETQFPNLTKSDCSLAAIACEVWEGFIFVNLNPRPGESLENSLAEFGRDLKGFPFADMMQVAGFAAEVKANWKIIMGIFQEGYHVPTLHNSAVANAGTGADNPFCHPLSLRLYERNRSISVYFNPEHRPSPAETLAFKYGASLLSTDADLPKGVNPTRDAYWLFDANVIFPNLILDLSSTAFWTFQFSPLAVDRTIFEAKFYMRPAHNAGERIAQEYNKVLLRETIREDLKVHEDIQRNMASGALGQVHLSDQEIAVRHFYTVIEDRISR